MQKEKYIMKLFDLKTDNIQFLKKLIDSLKEISVETNFDFSNQTVKISKMNSKESICCFMVLKNADDFCFSSSYSDDNPLVVGINVLILSKIFKGLSVDNIVNIFVDNSNKNLLCLKLENKNKSEITNYEISFIELNQTTITLPRTVFDVSLEIDSKYFHKTIKDIHNLESKSVEMKFCNNQFFFSGSGGYVSRETIIEENTNNNAKNIVKILDQKENVNISQGKFCLKDILSVCKFCSLSKTIIIRLKNDTPLLLEFKLGKYGTVKLLVNSVA